MTTGSPSSMTDTWILYVLHVRLKAFSAEIIGPSYCADARDGCTHLLDKLKFRFYVVPILHSPARRPRAARTIERG